MSGGGGVEERVRLLFVTRMVAGFFPLSLYTSLPQSAAVVQTRQDTTQRPREKHRRGRKRQREIELEKDRANDGGGGAYNAENMDGSKSNCGGGWWAICITLKNLERH